MGLHMFPAHGVANDAFRDNPALVPLDESPVAYAQQEHGWVAVETSQACDPNQAPELAQASQEGDVGLASSSAVPDPESGERVVDRKAASKVQDSTQMEDQGVDPGCASPDFTSATLAAPDAKPNNAKYRPEVYEDDLSSWIAWKKLAQARLLHLSPAWFSVTMGTGMLGNLFLLAPWQDVHAVLRWPGTVLIVFNCMLFLLFTLMMLLRYAIFPSVLRLTLTHSQQSLFLGTPAMSLTTTLTGLLAVGQAFNLHGLGTYSTTNYPSFGVSVTAAVLYFVTMFVSLAVAIGVPWSMMTWQTHTLRQTTALLLLPIVPPITVGNAGGSFADVLRLSADGHRAAAPAVADRLHSLAWTITVFSYVLMGIGLLLALSILVLYFQRLLLYKAPPREIILSVMLPLGPCGQGADGLIHLGASAAALLPSSARSGSSLDLPMGIALHAAGLLAGLLLWALGIWWFVLALLTIGRERYRGHLPFNMGWWSMTFPTGSLCMATARIALTLDSQALRIVFALSVGLNACIWAICMLPTLRGFLSGDLLIAPCISNVSLRP